jgi:hypothetical protein
MLVDNISNLSKPTIEKNGHSSSQIVLSGPLTMQLEQFKNEFDLAVANYSSSIGWVELAKIRNELYAKYNLSNEEFYCLVEQLANKYQDKYELSTGGNEGLMVRGLIHGLVRCI